MKHCDSLSLKSHENRMSSPELYYLGFNVMKHGKLWGLSSIFSPLLSLLFHLTYPFLASSKLHSISKQCHFNAIFFFFCELWDVLLHENCSKSTANHLNSLQNNRQSKTSAMITNNLQHLRVGPNSLKSFVSNVIQLYVNNIVMVIKLKRKYAESASNNYLFSLLQYRKIIQNVIIKLEECQNV